LKFSLEDGSNPAFITITGCFENHFSKGKPELLPFSEKMATVPDGNCYK